MEKLIKSKRGIKSLTWTLRVLLLFVAIFFMAFSFDVFGEPGRSSWAIIQGFLVHNIFTLILLLNLWVVWKWENHGGILLLLVGGAMVLFFSCPLHIMCHTWILISLPVILGILFLCNYYLIKSKN